MNVRTFESSAQCGFVWEKPLAGSGLPEIQHPVVGNQIFLQPTGAPHISCGSEKRRLTAQTKFRRSNAEAPAKAYCGGISAAGGEGTVMCPGG